MFWSGKKPSGVVAGAFEDTYFRWLQRTDEQLRAALDADDLAAGSG
jgi:hypothetical protein